MPETSSQGVSANGGLAVESVMQAGIEQRVTSVFSVCDFYLRIAGVQK